MEKFKNSRIPIMLLYILLFLLGGLSRNAFGISDSINSAFIYSIIVAIWFHDIRRRVLDDSISRIFTAICSFAFFLLIARTVKYDFTFETDYLDTLTWYLPSIGVLQIATLFLFLSLEIGGSDKRGFKKYHLLAIPGIIINILILTNDIHNWAYRFKADGSCEHGVLFFIYIGWVVVMFAASLFIMYRKCSVNPGRKHIWIPMAMLIAAYLGINLIVYIFDKDSMRPPIKYGWYEIFIFMLITYTESSISIGLIPTRSGFDTLFKESSVAVEIKDIWGNTVIKTSADLTESSDMNILHKHAAIPGGYIYWNDDISDINRITEIILNSENELSEEQYLIKAERKLLDKGEEYSVKSALYDDIVDATSAQAEHIEELLSQSNPDFSELAIYGVYIKRKANLMIISTDKDTIDPGELYISLKDALEYLKIRSIRTSLNINGTEENLKAPVSSAVVISLFDGYERFVEQNLMQLTAVSITIDTKDKLQLNIDAMRGKEEVSYVLS